MLVVGAASAATLMPSKTEALGESLSCSHDLRAIEDGKFGAKAPPTKKPPFVGAASAATPASSKTEVRGESPSCQRLRLSERLSPRPIVAMEKSRPRMRDKRRLRRPHSWMGFVDGSPHCRSSLSERPSPRSLRHRRREVRGESPSCGKINRCRSGFSRDPCVIENRRLGVAGAASAATLASSKTEVRGERPSYRKMEDCAQDPETLN
jgi:hypothetical protein